MNDVNEKFCFVGCVPYGSNKTGFALSIFCRETDQSTRLMQYVDNISEKILAFKFVEFDQSKFVDFSCTTFATIGSDPIFTFIDNEGKISTGTLLQIKHALINFEENNPKEISISLQIKELLGTQEEKRALRKRFRNIIYDLGDVSAANFFVEDSVLKIELWNLLIKFSPSPDITDAILRIRSKINVRIQGKNIISVQTEALEAINYPLHLIENITKLLQAEFNDTFKPDFDKSSEAQPETTDHDRIYEYAISAVAKSRRQEERTAILLRILSEEFDLGKRILSVYNTDRGKFASNAIRKMSSMMISDRPDYIPNDRLSEMIFDQLYKECFPMSRGALLYFFAKHFSSDALISKSILQKLSGGKNRYVDAWKNQIYYALNQAKPKIYSEDYFDQTDIFQELEIRGNDNTRSIR